MPADITTARDEMLSLFRTGWLADANSAGVPIFYSQQKQDPGSDVVAYAVARVIHQSGGQSNLAHGNGKQRYNRSGIVAVDILTLFGEGLVGADVLTQIALDIFTSATTPSGVWFPRSRGVETGIEFDRQKTEVIIDFQYTEIKTHGG